MTKKTVIQSILIFLIFFIFLSFYLKYFHNNSEVLKDIKKKKKITTNQNKTSTYINNIDYEIIIVNNNSQDDSIEYIKEKYPQLNIINSQINRGYAGGCNLGAKNAIGKFLFFLNNDTISNNSP